MRQFIYRSQPAHVVFGEGTLSELGPAIETVGGRRALLLSTPGQAQQARVATAAVAAIVGHFDGATMHTPIEVTQRALAAAQDAKADCLVAFGGGSTIGLSKAIALRTDLAQVVIPTTYAGSEMTAILGQTENGRKTTLRSPKVLPELVIYDVALTLGLPVAMSGVSGINAIAHAVEGLYAQDANPILEMMALSGVKALAGALPRIAQQPSDVEARSEALYGAWLCGTVLGLAGMAIHHKLCHTLGGLFALPHAETHAIVLPHAVAYNSEAAPQAMQHLAAALGGGEPAQALYDLGRAVGAPAALRDIGMPGGGIDRAADQAVENPYWNPRQVERAGVRALIAQAWAGKPPATGLFTP